MKLTVLMDNNTYIDWYYLGEPAACYLLEDGERTVLFDTGYSDAFLENARRLSVDLSRVSDIVLSHGHNDHTGGLDAFLNRFTQPVRLYAHPGVFLPKRHRGLNVGCPVSLAALPARVEARLSAEPLAISEHIVFLGQIPRVYDFEKGRAIGEARRPDGTGWGPDELWDDTAVALAVPGGTFVVTGCAHSGICNTVAAAKAQTGARVLGAFGGFHLFDADEKLDRTIQTLHALGVDKLYPCHCTSLAVKCAFLSAFPVDEVGVGMTLEW